MDFLSFSRINRNRCEDPKGFNHPIGSWTLSDWMTAAMGELGEAANLVKKLNRHRDGVPGNCEGETAEVLAANLADEIADTVIYLDLLAQSLGVDLGAAVASKFNRTSLKVGAPQRLPQDRCIDWARIQSRLKQIGYFPGPADGIAGPLTRSALAAFQSDYKIRVSAHIDRETMIALFGDDDPQLHLVEV